MTSRDEIRHRWADCCRIQNVVLERPPATDSRQIKKVVVRSRPDQCRVPVQTSNVSNWYRAFTLPDVLGRVTNMNEMGALVVDNFGSPSDRLDLTRMNEMRMFSVRSQAMGNYEFPIGIVRSYRMCLGLDAGRRFFSHRWLTPQRVGFVWGDVRFFLSS